ncbi:uncharacterized protein LOC111370539 isoform X3 [Olea europaea var. sylvestris]|uniref:uncharacterized protein LOC111370539 isoform X3 n=1 Tax=Olea europaea var. sylvestris TaxID=158386 RepID=UPI000C1CE4F3|nr:uncharacterized protein LOC111370539 isoform X3 [Olea europaea var. sylvestris]
MSNKEVRKVSLEDIQLVQNLIERCLQLYMSPKEVVSTLLHHAKIEPGFTELVWQKLETENQRFFEAYYPRLLVKDLILRFNQLLERQVELMRQICPPGVASTPRSNGSQFYSMHNNSAYHTPEHAGALKPENLDHAISIIPSVYTNGASSRQPSIQIPVDVVSDDMQLAQSSNSGTIKGIDGGIIKSEEGYTGDSPFMFGGDSDLLETHNGIGDAPVSSFSSLVSNSQPLNENILEGDTNMFGFLGQIPRNFSFSDLTADFSNSTDILESYSRSPFLGSDTNFLEPHIKEEQQGINNLDTVSECLSYNDFGSD